MKFYNTFLKQIEILPRLTIMYSKELKGVAFEWLWFGVCVLYKMN